MHKKILVVTDNVRDQTNGVVTTFRNLEGLAGNDGYSIVYLDPGQFAHFDCPGYPEVKISWPWRMGEKIKTIAPHHVHIATEGPLGLAAKVWLDRQGWRYNTSYHTRWPEFLDGLYHVPPSWTWQYLRWFHRHSGSVLTTTVGMVQELESHGFVGPLKIWSRGVDRRYLVPSRPRERSGDRLRVLYAGRVSREKNLQTLCALHDRYDIVIVGDGPCRHELEQAWPQVEFTGYLWGSDLADAYQDADVFCFPSQADTFGIVIIEAMSLGTPVAAYPVLGPKDIIEPDVTGVLDWDLATAIQRASGLDRHRVKEHGQSWTWEGCWQLFRESLVRV